VIFLLSGCAVRFSKRSAENSVPVRRLGAVLASSGPDAKDILKSSYRMIFQ